MRVPEGSSQLLFHHCEIKAFRFLLARKLVKLLANIFTLLRSYLRGLKVGIRMAYLGI